MSLSSLSSSLCNRCRCRHRRRPIHTHTPGSLRGPVGSFTEGHNGRGRAAQETRTSVRQSRTFPKAEFHVEALPFPARGGLQHCSPGTKARPRLDARQGAPSVHGPCWDRLGASWGRLGAVLLNDPALGSRSRNNVYSDFLTYWARWAPPGPQTGLPKMSPRLPKMGACPGLPKTSPGLPKMSPGLIKMSRGMPKMPPGLPKMGACPELPKMSPGLPKMSAGLPKMFPGLLRVLSRIPAEGSFQNTR